MTELPILYGATYSVYVRIARLALAEKNVAYTLNEIDVFAADGPPGDYLNLHPFARIPAFRHGDFALFETGAITRYVDDAFAGPSLQPDSAQERARMNQIVAIADNYLYRPLVWGIYVASDEAAKRGTAPALDDGLARSRHCLKVLADLADHAPYLVGSGLSLADLHLAPMIAYGCATEPGRALLAAQPRLLAWWERIQQRPSVIATRFKAEEAVRT